MDNEILRALHARKSVRVFTDEPVTAGERAAILEAAFQAPTAGNQQLYTILDITDPRPEGAAGGSVRPPALHCQVETLPGVSGGLPPVGSCLPRRRGGIAPQGRAGGSFAGDGGCLHRGPERRDGGGKPRHRQLLHRGCAGKRRGDAQSPGAAAPGGAGLHAGVRPSHPAAEGPGPKPVRFREEAVVCKNTYRDRTEAELREDFNLRGAGVPEFEFDRYLQAFCQAQVRQRLLPGNEPQRGGLFTRL